MKVNNQGKILQFPNRKDSLTNQEPKSISHEILKTPKKFSLRYLTCAIRGHDWEILISRIGPMGYPRKDVFKVCKRCQMSVETIERMM